MEAIVLKKRYWAGLLFVLMIFPSLGFFVPAMAEGTLEGKVVGISDGDTITVLTEKREQVKVRLAEIDTPEARQPYGTRARQGRSPA